MPPLSYLGKRESEAMHILRKGVAEGLANPAHWQTKKRQGFFLGVLT